MGLRERRERDRASFRKFARSAAGSVYCCTARSTKFPVEFTNFRVDRTHEERNKRS